MWQRLPPYLMIIAACIFSAVQGFAIVKHLRVDSSATAIDYIDSFKILLALLAIVVAVRSLRRQKHQ